MMPGWEELTASLETARTEIAAAAPDAAAATDGEAYLMRVLTSSLADGFLGHILTTGGLTPALPTRGGPNPDYQMHSAGIDPTRRYRVDGRLNDSERTDVGLYTVQPDGALILAGYASYTAENVDADRRFVLEIAAGAEGPGTLPLLPDTRTLIVRTQHRDPVGTPARLNLSGGTPIADLSLVTGTTAGALARVGQMTLHHVRQFLAWSQATSANPNLLTRPPAALAASVQGVPDTSYFLGYYALDPGEWLEVLIPEGLTGYWSLHAGNHWLETLPGAGVNDLSAVADADGRIRVRIGPQLPGDVANRIDTIGRTRGVLLFRVTANPDVAPPDTMVRKAG